MPRNHHTHPGHTHVPPHVHVHAHPHVYHPQVHIVPPIRPHVHVHRRYAYYGSGALLVTAAILIPAIIIASLLTPTAGVATSYAASSMTLGAASAGAGTAAAFSAATFGIGALLIYGAIGLGYLYSSAKECYSGNKTVMDVMASRVVNEDGFSVKGVLKSIGAVVWSPFLLIGGLAGMGVKAAVNACNTKKSTNYESLPEVDQKNSASDLRTTRNLSENRNEPTAPFHTKSIFADLGKKIEKDVTHSNEYTLQC
ncbi:transmembrane protein [Legionella gratiana]|uniref:Transmembrane protein n=1 Tax=Legionella gratiana TaxID=45066 RepID=A0A378JB33_9GAMM|nr:hypothetical protein [Legionella gratiana]KTD11073.1 transmembrane protein [Legionella gratiana]STX44566.1 transmembrane protein [Legionella gratiana]